ncbi:MAG: NUDIX domain-containing protein [Parcubacteria group bacterium]|jgi:8-oxo-dGTP diphosphatase
MENKIGKFLVATGAIVENSTTGKILLLKRSGKKDYSPGIWEYTTGRLHQFEDPEDGLRREVMEETGLEVEIVKPISIFHIFRGEKIAENELVGIMFWCKTDSEEVIVSEEHSGYAWVTAEEALKMMEKPGMKEDIRAFIKERSKA